MEINKLNSVLGVYRSVSQSKTEKKSESKPAKNLDRIEFDFARSLEAAKANISAEVARSEKQDALSQTAAESLPSSEELADCIMSFLV